MRGAKFVRRMVMLGAALLLITSLQLLPDWSVRRSTSAELWVQHTLQVLHATQQVLSTIENAETSERGYLLTGDVRYLQPFQSALSNQLQAKLNLRRFTIDNGGQQARIGKLDRLVEIRLSALSGIIELYKTQGPSAAVAAMGTGGGSLVMGEIRELMHEIEQEEYRLLNIRTKAAAAEAARTMWVLRGDGVFLIGLLVVFGVVNERDISNHQRAQELLKSSEEQFHTLANAIPQLCWIAHGDGGIFWYNQRWFDFTGTKLHDMDGWGWQSVHDPEVLPVVMEGWVNAIASGTPFEMVFPLRAADGVFHPFLTRVMPMRDESGKIVRWFGTNTDITVQRKTEDALRGNQERLQLAQQVAHIGTFEWNLQTGAKQRTRQLEEMYGLSPASAASQKSWLDLMRPEDKERVRRQMREAMVTGSFEAEFGVIWPNGTERWLFGKARVFNDDAGKPWRLIGAIVDVTDRKQAALEVLRMNGELEVRVQQRTIQLESANKELEAFAYSVSHDLRAPLRGIDGWSLAVLEDYDAQLDDGARQYLNRVRSETQRMGHLIDDMLQLSRVTRGEMKSDRVDLTALANSIVAKLRDAQPERSMEFVIEPELVAVGDGRLLEIALTNLFSNAVKFTGTKNQALIEFGRLQREGEMAFYIRDNGAGFNMAHAGNLFGAFQRLHKASEFPGTGIGLATVQRVVRRHGGCVWAEAHVNCGATFCFTLGVAA